MYSSSNILQTVEKVETNNIKFMFLMRDYIVYLIIYSYQIIIHWLETSKLFYL